MLTAAPAGFGVGYVFQAGPFQRSIMVPPQSVVPTAQASDGEMATTPSRASRKPAAGLGAVTAFQRLPFQWNAAVPHGQPSRLV